MPSLPVTNGTEDGAAGCRKAQGRDRIRRYCTARISVPPFDRSPYDGYAFRGEDTLSARQKPEAGDTAHYGRDPGRYGT